MSVDLSAAPLLADSLEVSLDIWGDDGPRGRVDGSSASRLVVGIPSSVLGSDATYEIRLSKVNAVRREPRLRAALKLPFPSLLH
jgi:hypothetical protein